MKQLECSTCSERWNGAYNDDGRCVTCDGVVTEIEPFTPGAGMGEADRGGG